MYHAASNLRLRLSRSFQLDSRPPTPSPSPFQVSYSMLCPICNEEKGSCNWSAKQWKTNTADLLTEWTVGCKLCRMQSKVHHQNTLWHLRKADVWFNQLMRDQVTCQLKLYESTFTTADHDHGHHTEDRRPVDVGHGTWAVIKTVLFGATCGTYYSDGRRMEGFVATSEEFSVPLNCYAWHLWMALRYAQIDSDHLHVWHSDNVSWADIRLFLWKRCGWR